MDERLRHLVRAAATEPEALGRAVVELCRAGEHVAAGHAVRERLLKGDWVPAGALDALSPDSVDRLTPRVLPGERGHSLGVGEWRPDEGGLYLGDQVRGNGLAVVDWDLEEGPASLLARSELRHPPPVTSLYELAGLALDGSGTRLALSVRCFYSGAAQRSQAGLWYVWDVYDVPARCFAELPEQLCQGASALTWCGDLVVGASPKQIFSWGFEVEAKPSPILKETEVVVGVGTRLGRSKSVLSFYRGVEATPYGQQPLPMKLAKGAWKGIVAAWGGRALCCDRLGGRLVLLDAEGVLAEAKLPEGPAMLVAVRPSPSGRVVALRYQRTKSITLVDLRSGEHRVIELEHAPRDMLWAPSGRRLAIPSRLGRLQLLECFG